MIRYHDERGHLPGRRRIAGRHRYFDQADVDWLSALEALLAAGIPTATAVRAMRDEATREEQAQIESAPSGCSAATSPWPANNWRPPAAATTWASRTG